MNRSDFAELVAYEMQGCEEYQSKVYSSFPSSFSREEYEMTLKELWNDEHNDYFLNSE